jgi:hypothetical protein
VLSNNIGVSTGPGATAFTSTPWPATCRASDRVKPMSAAFAVAYCTLV